MTEQQIRYALRKQGYKLLSRKLIIQEQAGTEDIYEKRYSIANANTNFIEVENLSLYEVEAWLKA